MDIKCIVACMNTSKTKDYGKIKYYTITKTLKIKEVKKAYKEKDFVYKTAELEKTIDKLNKENPNTIWCLVEV